MCLFPIRSCLPPEGGRPIINPEGDLILPCGKCKECISKRALEWALRARHEMAMHNENSFITLTYDEKNLKSEFIIKPDFQNFMKRLRKKLQRNIRYMVSYEYGSQKFRPHMHAIIFGWDPANQKKLKKTSSGHQLFTSPDLEKLWDKGFHSIGTANEKTAYYIASYALKGNKRSCTNHETGEVISLADTMDVSKRPAIGYNYLQANAKQLIDSGEMLPRYYLKKLETLNPELFQRYEDERLLNFKTRSSQELHAKFVIDDAKTMQSKTEFRETPENTQSRKAHELYLKSKRDEYHLLTSKETK